MRTSDYSLMKKGYLNKYTSLELLFRRAAAAILQPYSDKVIRETQLWFVQGDEERIKLQREQSDKASLETLNKLKTGKYEYIRVGDKIVEMIKAN